MIIAQKMSTRMRLKKMFLNTKISYEEVEKKSKEADICIATCPTRMEKLQKAEKRKKREKKRRGKRKNEAFT